MMQPTMYEDVVIEKNGNVFEGDVVSFLSLLDWCCMHGYSLVSSNGYVWAHKLERTNIKPRRITSGPYRFPKDLEQLLGPRRHLSMSLLKADIERA